MATSMALTDFRGNLLAVHGSLFPDYSVFIKTNCLLLGLLQCHKLGLNIPNGFLNVAILDLRQSFRNCSHSFTTMRISLLE